MQLECETDRLTVHIPSLDACTHLSMSRGGGLLVFSAYCVAPWLVKKSTNKHPSRPHGLREGVRRRDETTVL